MNWKKEVWSIFLRTLAIFVAFWMVIVLVMTARNLDNMERRVASQFDAPHRTTLINVKGMVEDGTAQERKGRLAWLINANADFNDSVITVAGVYDSWGRELARSQIAGGFIAVDGMSKPAHYILFDAVLTDEEQIYFAETLRRECGYNVPFFGTASGKINAREGWENVGLYGEVTGILDGEDIYPQKLTFYYEDKTITLVDSNDAMFNGVELTTVRFDYAAIESVLNSRYRSAENMLKLYQKANKLVTKTGPTAWSQMSSTTYGGRGRVVSTVDHESGVPYIWVYMYDRFSLATCGMGESYVGTFLIALLATVFVARSQIKTLKKERQFTRAVAHEIKTPAAVLRATAEALCEGASPERQREYLSSMMEESDRLAFMVSELLDLSRMEGSSAVLKRQPVDLTALTGGAFERLRKSMERHGLVLTLDLQPVTVSGDLKRLEQVVNNLAVNVLEHAQEGPVNVFLSVQGERAVLTVGNVAPSLTGEQLRHIWEPFYKVDESRSGTGSGLGLAVVKNVVTLHGGTCSARTASDRIEFRVELPVNAG